MSQRVAVLGTGIMGAPMARNIAGAGFPVTVWNRTRARAEPLSDVARVADSAAAAAAGADIVITMVDDSAAVTDVLFGAAGAAEAAPAGALFIDMSSIQPSVARDHAERLRAMGKRHLDSPVSGGEGGAKAANLAIMTGGEPDDFAEAEPVLEAMGRPMHVGPHGAGQVAKLANQQIVGITIGAVAEALLLAEAAGCDPAAAREALMGGFAGSRILEVHGQRMLERDWVPGGAVHFQLKDMENALEAAREAGLTLPLTEKARDAYRALADEMEMRGLDHSAYLRWLEALNGRRIGQAPNRMP